MIVDDWLFEKSRRATKGLVESIELLQEHHDQLPEEISDRLHSSLTHSLHYALVILSWSAGQGSDTRPDYETILKNGTGGLRAVLQKYEGATLEDARLIVDPHRFKEEIVRHLYL